jgi:putative nucleotidyltransferase with HDIG domain
VFFVQQSEPCPIPGLDARFAGMSMLADGELSLQRNITAKRLCQLPLFNTVALKMLRISLDSDSAFQETEALFKADPALAAELLVVANSAEFGLRACVGTVRHALAILGLERIRNLVVTIAMHFYVRQGPRQAHIQAVWAHSFATAVIAEELARAAKQPEGLLYTAGLMHDVGRLGLLMTSTEKYSRLFSVPFLNVAEANAVETGVLGLDHCAAGVVLAQNWGLPVELQTCIRHHHSAPAENEDHALDLTRMACRMADALGFWEFQVNEPDDLLSAEKVLSERYRNRPELAPQRLNDLIVERMAPIWD